jgi:hypothetical protein
MMKLTAAQKEVLTGWGPGMMEALNLRHDEQYRNFQREPVAVVTECSGMEAPVLALGELGFKVRHLVATEIAGKAQRFIARNFKPAKIFGNILSRAATDLPKTQFYFAG